MWQEGKLLGSDRKLLSVPGNCFCVRNLLSVAESCLVWHEAAWCDMKLLGEAGSSVAGRKAAWV